MQTLKVSDGKWQRAKYKHALVTETETQIVVSMLKNNKSPFSSEALDDTKCSNF